jgi:multiple sugar transport system permease protein
MSGFASHPGQGGFAGYFFALPAAVLILFVMIVPIATVITLSFTDYTLGALSWSFTGIENFSKAAGDRDLHRALANTALYVAVVVSGSVLLGLLIALLVHQTRRLRRLYEVIFFLPVASTLVALAIVWQFLLHSRIGPVNALISAAGFERVGFFSEPGIALYALAAIGIWHLVGFNMILFLAGLAAIPKDLYDAAAVDGADGFWDRLFRVTWPMLGPTTIFVTITSTITAFQVFDTVAVITSGGPMGSTDVILHLLYRESFRSFDTGYAAALTLIFLAIIVGITALQLLVFDKRVHYK